MQITLPEEEGAPYEYEGYIFFAAHGTARAELKLRRLSNGSEPFPFLLFVKQKLRRCSRYGTTPRAQTQSLRKKLQCIHWHQGAIELACAGNNLS